MNDYITTNEIIEGLAPLIDDGRITGHVLVDGVTVLDDMQQVGTRPAPPQYDEYGFSTPDEFGCVRIKSVDEHFDDWAANGNDIQKSMAERRSEYFGILIPGREYAAGVAELIAENSRSLWQWLGNKPKFAPFAYFNDRYINPETGETAASLTFNQQITRKWRINDDYRGESIPNHTAIGYGNKVRLDNPDWVEYMTVKLPAAIIKRAVEGAEIARRKAENPNAVLGG